MEFYIVGGYVRDRLLGMQPKDKDWVVVGGTPERLINQGFSQVGRQFPVFLHPETKEQYALACANSRQTPPSPEVTLIEDLARRDLTINAMAMTPDGQLVDPFSGARDLQDKLLRHVGASFTDDPIRVLRLARFAARYDFKVATETLTMVKQMAAAGELDDLVPDRVWSEIGRAMAEKRPAKFIELLHETGALAHLMPEVDRLFGVPQPAKHHPEIDTGQHLLMALDAATKLTADPLVRFAVLVHDLGKGITPRSEWPQHIGHEAKGARLVDDFCTRYRAPKHYQRLGRNCAEFHTYAHRAFELKSKTFVKLFEALSAFQKPDDFDRFLLACQADAQGRLGLESTPYPQADLLRGAYLAAASVGTDDILASGITGAAVGRELHRRRLEAVQDYLTSNRNT